MALSKANAPALQSCVSNLNTRKFHMTDVIFALPLYSDTGFPMKDAQLLKYLKSILRNGRLFWETPKQKIYSMCGSQNNRFRTRICISFLLQGDPGNCVFLNRLHPLPCRCDSMQIEIFCQQNRCVHILAGHFRTPHSQPNPGKGGRGSWRKGLMDIF